MATFTSEKAAIGAAVNSSGVANSVVFSDAITPTAGALNDIYRVCRIPAGTKAYRLTVRNADLDSNGSPLLAVKCGYSYVDGSTPPAGADVAFIASGSTILQAATAAGAGSQFTVVPFLIEKDAFVTFVVTAAAATFASGAITVIVEAEGLGAK